MLISGTTPHSYPKARGEKLGYQLSEILANGECNCFAPALLNAWVLIVEIISVGRDPAQRGTIQNQRHGLRGYSHSSSKMAP